MVATASLATGRASSSPTSKTNFTVAVVRAPPPNWPLPILSTNWTGITLNLSQAVDKGIELVADSARSNASLISFPELWFPAYPSGSNKNDWYRDHLPGYVQNCMVVGGPEWNRLVLAAQQFDIYVAFGFCERTDRSIFMAQALISPSGDLLVHRHKLRPSGEERLIFSDGSMDMLDVVATPHGRIGLLECYEHFWPSMTIPMQAQLENIHLSEFSYLVDDDVKGANWWEVTTVNLGAEAHYAVLSGAYVFHSGIGAVWVIDPTGVVLANISSEVGFDEVPVLYYSINTTSFNTSKTYDVDGGVSWSVVEQIRNGFPSYIPRDPGTFVDHHEVAIAALLSGNFSGERSK
ncbi:hypothetical protein M409DRAFT_37986 [Zasmidium cellare ATCC 36951]|uniref:nitrilase n=1 Tax=Zasmidium cellare ATCC 36951 TaxID=1080233 RepID=A0A6A6BZ78_ZASCE|nr:uncharacterized protein M409DRAFT_37986 [Zasmidium cellare ATCC 36951]KAF2159220.1 hypothetical protein M409DRAFT_37986 [Zasmidium cellare ATCC 36951]